MTEDAGDALDFERDLQIDSDSLDVEWRRFPSLLMRYCAETRDTRRTRDDRELKLDILKAQLENDIRSNPQKHGITKLTEGAITNVVTLNAEYQKAVRLRDRARRDNDLVSSAVKALEWKGRSLERLVQLHGQNYFGDLGDGPRANVGRTLGETVDKRIKKRLKEKLGTQTQEKDETNG